MAYDDSLVQDRLVQCVTCGLEILDKGLKLSKPASMLLTYSRLQFLPRGTPFGIFRDIFPLRPVKDFGLANDLLTPLRANDKL